MKRKLIFVVFGVLLVFAPFVVSAFRPNFTIDWNRVVPSKLPVETLAGALDDPKLWPVYYHSLKEVRFETKTGEKLEKPALGAQVIYSVEPKGKEWKRFDLTGEVVEFDPGKKMRVRLLGDSKKKLTRVFDDYEWEVGVEEAPAELKAKGFTSVAYGNAKAHTSHWRGRVFGTLTPRILMNQVYYVDLVKLGTLERQKEAAQNNQEPSYQ